MSPLGLGEPGSMLFETFVAARGLPLMTYSTASLLDVDTLALAMSGQAVPPPYHGIRFPPPSL